MNYFFEINIQHFNVSDSLGFLAVNIFGAAIVSFIGYVYLKSDEDKNFLKNMFGVVSFFGQGSVKR